MLARLFKSKAPEPIAYETARDLAQSPEVWARTELATRNDTQPEVLYFLAGDQSSSVRQAIAANPSTPGKANVLLATDASDEVRAELARKIGRLLPNLAPGQSDKIGELTLQTLELLAQDQVPRVRAALAEELKTRADAPKGIVLRLAQDLAAMVATPILEYSPLLPDADLLEIIAKGQLNERLTAISRRNGVSGDVSDAIVATMDVSAVATLLANPSAQVREETLDAIVDNAAGIESWHRPLVVRSELSMRAIRRIAGFVASSLIEQLSTRQDLPDDLRADLRRGVKQRLEGPAPGGESAAERASAMHAAKQLNEEAVDEALAAGDREFVLNALVLLARLPATAVRRAISTRSAKAVTAIAWRSGLSMRLAMKLQSQLALIPSAGLLPARNGTDYPLSDKEMETQIDILAGAER